MHVTNNLKVNLHISLDIPDKRSRMMSISMCGSFAHNRHRIWCREYRTIKLSAVCSLHSRKNYLRVKAKISKICFLIWIPRNDDALKNFLSAEMIFPNQLMLVQFCNYFRISSLQMFVFTIKIKSTAVNKCCGGKFCAVCSDMLTGKRKNYFLGFSRANFWCSSFFSRN